MDSLEFMAFGVLEKLLSCCLWALRRSGNFKYLRKTGGGQAGPGKPERYLVSTLVKKIGISVKLCYLNVGYILFEPTKCCRIYTISVDFIMKISDKV